jgi:hypothetical protein
MARQKTFTEIVLIRHPTGTKARIAAVIQPGEAYADVYREAIDMLLCAREAAKPKETT